MGLAGMYASLVHLSLSDATMLTFVAPILTGFSGALILKETVSLREMFAGCRHPRLYLPMLLFTECF
jgi:drug/metabolite transporter (DMT)-like permease